MCGLIKEKSRILTKTPQPSIQSKIQPLNLASKKSFAALELSSSLIQAVTELGYDEMTPIQAQSIPVLLEGRDLIGQSKTGSGKTAAFTLPILQKLNLGERYVQALILCPTRELCMQVAREVRKLGRHHSGLQVLILSGGHPLFPQVSSLEKGVHLVVGTPGRVLDHLNRETLDLRKISFLVLDEADRMLDMGFREDMEKILGNTPKNRQTVLFSATFPAQIETLSQAYQNRPARVTIEPEKQAASSIRQIFFEATPEVKFNGLLWILQQNQPESAIIFCNLKTTVMELTRLLAQAGVSTSCLHGDLDQNERDRVMAKFRNRSTRILIATDVAARGIDIENLDAVINFDLPSQADIYVHRIGRTGRAGQRGLAISLVTSREKGRIQSIEKLTGQTIEAKILAKVENLDVQEFKKALQQDAIMATLFIGGGRKEKMRPGDILGALTGEAGGLQASDIGKIEIHDHFSYVAVSKAIAPLAMERLRDGRIKGRKFRVEMVR